MLLSDSISNTNLGGFFRFYKNTVLTHPWLVLLTIFVLAFFAATQTRHYKVDASADSLVLEGDRDLEFFREVGKRYASEDYLVIAYQPKAGLLDEASLSDLAELVESLEAVTALDRRPGK